MRVLEPLLCMVSRVLASRNGILGSNEKARHRTGVRLRRALDRVQGRQWHQVQADPRSSPDLRFPDDGTECDDQRADRSTRTTPSEALSVGIGFGSLIDRSIRVTSA